jgi:hypothetical protein
MVNIFFWIRFWRLPCLRSSVWLVHVFLLLCMRTLLHRKDNKSVVWDVTLCGVVDRYHCFGGTCCLHCQGWSEPGRASGMLCTSVASGVCVVDEVTVGHSGTVEATGFTRARYSCWTGWHLRLYLCTVRDTDLVICRGWSYKNFGNVNFHFVVEYKVT